MNAIANGGCVNKRTTLSAILVLVATVSLLTVFLQAQALHGPLTNPDVIRMVRDKMPESTIIGKIQSGPVKFDLSPGGLALLRQGNVSPNILRVMMAAEKTGANPAGSGGATPGATGTVPGKPPSGKPTAAGTAPASSGGGKPTAVRYPTNLHVSAGPRIKITGLVQPSLPSTIAQTLQQQSSQTHADKSTIVTAGRPIVAGRTSTGANPSGSSTTQSAPGPTSLSQKMTHAPQPISACVVSSNPTVLTVSGKSRAIVFTPDVGPGPNPNNQYSIKGCNFGQAQGRGEVHIFGPFINHSSPVRLAIDSWSDNLIVVTFDPTFQDEYDLNNITLVVVASNGQNIQLAVSGQTGATFTRPGNSKRVLRIIDSNLGHSCQ